MTTFSLLSSLGFVTTAFLQIGSTPIWVPLAIILIIILLFWWGLTRNQIPNEDGGENEELPNDNQSINEAENIVPEIFNNEEIRETESEIKGEPNQPIVNDEPLAPDDLKLIEGIGPKISSVLADAGIVTFAQLADSDKRALEKIVREDAGLKLANPGSWPEQARLASEGNWDELEQLQDQLHGGKHK